MAPAPPRRPTDSDPLDRVPRRVTRPRIRRAAPPVDAAEERRIHEELMADRRHPYAESGLAVLGLSVLAAAGSAQEMGLTPWMAMQTVLLWIPIVLIAGLALRLASGFLPAFRDSSAASVIVVIMIGLAFFQILLSEGRLGRLHNPEAARAARSR